MLETGVAGNDRRAGPHRDWQSADRLCRAKKARDRSGVQSPAVPVTPTTGLGSSDKDH